MAESDAIKIWRLKIKAFAIAAITTFGSVALWQGHDGAIVVGTMAAIGAIAGVKVFNAVKK